MEQNNMDEWIKTTDRLPEKEETVLAYTRSNKYPVRFVVLTFYLYKWTENSVERILPMFRDDSRSWHLDNISHWKPLGKAPSE